MVVRINIKCNRQFMTDDAEGGSNSDTITPQVMDQEGGARRGGGVRGGAIVSQIGSWKVMST